MAKITIDYSQSGHAQVQAETAADAGSVEGTIAPTVRRWIG